MAKFISSIFTEVSGSVAGTTYARNKNGSYIRNKSVPVNRNTQAQQAARSIFTGVSASWSGLTNEQRASFESQIINYPYTDKLGQLKYYTASQLYKSVNNSLLQVGLTGLTVLPPPITLVSITDLEVFVVQAAGGSITINAVAFSNSTVKIVPAGFELLFYGTDIKPNGFSSPKPSDFRFIGKVESGETSSDLNFSNGYSAKFSNSWLSASMTGAKIWFGCKMVAVSTGQRTNSYFTNQAVIDADL